MEAMISTATDARSVLPALKETDQVETVPTLVPAEGDRDMGQGDVIVAMTASPPWVRLVQRAGVLYLEEADERAGPIGRARVYATLGVRKRAAVVARQ